MGTGWVRHAEGRAANGRWRLALGERGPVLRMRGRADRPLRLKLLPGCGGAVALAALLVVAMMLVVAVAQLSRPAAVSAQRHGNAPSPSPEAPAVAAITAASTTAAPRPTSMPEPTPEPVVIPDVSTLNWPEPSMTIDSREALVDLYWWMIYTGAEYAPLDGLTLPKDDLMEITSEFSNYFMAFNYDTSVPFVQVALKPGVRVLLAIERGETDALNPEAGVIAEEARKIVERVVQPGMTEVARELALHDYIVEHSEYRLEAAGVHVEDCRGFFQSGALQCAGYVDTFRLLARLAGLDVEMVGGPTTRDPPGFKGHAWNLIRLDGLWYVVDLTWDDKVSGAATLEHTFFNLPPSSFGDTRHWDQAVCPDGDYAVAVDANYYYHDPKYMASDAGTAVALAVRQIDADGKAYVLFEKDESRAVASALAKHYGRAGRSEELSEDLDISLYRFELE